MKITVRTLLLLMLLVGAILSWNVKTSNSWLWVLLVFIATAIFLASYELDNRKSRLVYWVNWLMLIGSIAAAVFIYRNSIQ